MSKLLDTVSNNSFHKEQKMNGNNTVMSQERLWVFGKEIHPFVNVSHKREHSVTWYLLAVTRRGSSADLKGS